MRKITLLFYCDDWLLDDASPVQQDRDRTDVTSFIGLCPSVNVPPPLVNPTRKETRSWWECIETQRMNALPSCYETEPQPRVTKKLYRVWRRSNGGLPLIHTYDVTNATQQPVL